jgi:hypothetical protein
VLRKKLGILLAAVMVMGVMSVPPAMADPVQNRGNKGSDGPDKNLGGGQD